ncbi:MAG: HAD-IA family hydrolase [Coriobacteriia bacterium]|nr:HAD-IA family hydrolase [Coriobacteriia bacterium]
MKYKAILFDNDGTIVDTERAICDSFSHAMKEILGVENPDLNEYKKLIGLTLYDQFAHYSDDKDTIEALFKSYRAHNHKTLDDKISVFPGLKEVLEKLYNQGNFLGIVTSKRHDMCIHGLELLEIDKYFSYIQGMDDYDVHKPDPEALSYPCRKLGFDPKDVLYVGDSQYDIKSGNGAGCDTAAVLWGVSDIETLSAQNPNYFCEKPADLLKYC